MFWAFSFKFWPSLIAILLGHAWCMLGVRHLIYEDPVNQKMLIPYVVSAIWLTFHIVIVQLLVTNIGRVFVEAEIPRIDNKKLLDDMKEAVYIVDEKIGSVHFQNRTANKLTVQLTNDTQVSLLDNDNQFDFSRESFAIIDKKDFKAKKKEADAETVEKVLASEDYVSMGDIIKTQMLVSPNARVK